jgi:hypothetical protein
VLICPNYAELESSFTSWSERILRLSKELNCKLEIYGTPELHDSFAKEMKKAKINASTSNIVLEETDDFFITNGNFNVDDLIVFVAARTGSVSHFAGIDMFLSKLEKGRPLNDQIVIYPSQEIDENLYSGYDDFSSTPITKGVETMQKIGKEVGSIFKKG